MKNKKLFLWFLTVLLISVVTFFVIATNSIYLTPAVLEFPPAGSFTYTKTYSNVSGTTVNSTLNASNVNATHGTSIVNVSLMWQLAYNASRVAANNSFMLNQTFNNLTANQTLWNSSFDSTALPDGLYNLTLFVYNTSTDGAGFLVANTTIALNVTIDNTIPNVTNLTATAGDYTGFLPTGAAINLEGETLENVNFNVSSVLDETSKVKLVNFEFTNGTGDGGSFNVSATNRSGAWNVNYNLSTLRGGSHRIYIHVEDNSGNLNRTEFLEFVVNTPPNVTFNNSDGLNYTGSSGNQTFTVSVASILNQSGTRVNRFSVIFEFDNATGNRKNFTGNFSGAGELGAFVNFSVTYNVSRLEEGFHILRAYVNDSFGNFNFTENVSFTVDRSGPSITVTCTSNPKPGDTVTCTCQATDSFSKVKGVAKFAGGLTSESTTAGAVGGYTSSLCGATDYAGNSNSKAGTWTVVADTEDSGSGSGGSGGGTTSGSTGNFGQKTWSSIFAGETATVEVDNGVIGVTEVSFGVIETAYGGWVKVSRKESPPVGAENFDRNTYRVIEIATGTALREEIVANRKIDFKVEKSWLSGLSVSKTEVALYRLVDNKWTALPTTVGEDDGTYIHYSASTPGFSFFLIGQRAAGEAPVDVPEVDLPPVTPPADGGTGGAGDTESKGAGLAVIIVLVVLAVLAAVWFFVGRKNN